MREETLREANTVVVNHHYSLELASKSGGGTMSSSEGASILAKPKELSDLLLLAGLRLHAYEEPHGDHVERPRVRQTRGGTAAPVPPAAFAWLTFQGRCQRRWPLGCKTTLVQPSSRASKCR